MGGFEIVLKLNNIAKNISKIEYQAGTTLERNIRSQARMKFGKGESGYPYEYRNSFQKPDVVFYKDDEKAVHIHHPAAFVLEYGMGSQTITAKNSEFMRFIGKDGEVVYAKEVTIAPKKPTGYVSAAIKETKKDLKRIYKDILEGVDVING